MELTLLREENARLKVEHHRPPDAGRIIERMRHLGQASHVVRGDQEGVQAGEGAQAIRDGLVEACREIQEAVQGIQGRLSELSLDTKSKAGDQAMSSAIAAPSEEVGRKLAAGAEAWSDLSKGAA